MATSLRSHSSEARFILSAVCRLQPAPATTIPAPGRLAATASPSGLASAPQAVPHPGHECSSKGSSQSDNHRRDVDTADAHTHSARLPGSGAERAATEASRDDGTCQLPLPPPDKVAADVAQLLHLESLGHAQGQPGHAVGGRVAQHNWAGPNLDMLILHIKADDLFSQKQRSACRAHTNVLRLCC